MLDWLLHLLAGKQVAKPLTLEVTPTVDDSNPEQIDADNQDDIDRAATVLLADVDM